MRGKRETMNGDGRDQVLWPKRLVLPVSGRKCLAGSPNRPCSLGAVEQKTHFTLRLQVDIPL